MKYNSDKLKELKAKCCLLFNDGSSIVLHGITASFNNLKKRLLKKIDQDMKEFKKKQKYFQCIDTINCVYYQSNKID
jgi:hypothetical protein